MDSIEAVLKQLSRQTKQIAATLPADTFGLVRTSRNLLAIVDAGIVSQIRKQRWFAVISRGNHVYAVTDFNGKRIAMQRLVIAMTEDRWDFDEIKNISFSNKHPLDCRYENLASRIGRQAAMRNRIGKRNTSSKFKGVRKTISSSGVTRWLAQIKVDFGNIHLGTFSDEQTAALAYDEAARVLFEGAGHLNLPNAMPPPDLVLDVAERIVRARLKAKTKG